MPFLPFVLLLAWQAISRSASFALGWATALYFGQVPGRQGRVLSVVSLVAVGWVILIIGFALPLLAGAAAEQIGLVERNFSVEPIHLVGLGAALIAIPAAIAAATTWAGLGADRSLSGWVSLLPRAYPAVGSLGLAVLEMVVFTPLLAMQRVRHERVLLQVPFVMRQRGRKEGLIEAVKRALVSIGPDREIRVRESTGPKSWPMRTVAYAARHLLGTVVRGDPIRIESGELEIHAYASNVAIMGPKEESYRARAALEREVALGDAYLTWSEESQRFEDELHDLQRRIERGDLERDELRERLDELQQRVDGASLNGDEWNVVYRLRLQVETRALAG